MLGEKPISVYILDDQSMIRGALRAMLAQHGPIQVVGERGAVRPALAEIERLQPNVLLLDVAMPGLSGIDAIPLVRRVSPRTRILMLTVHEGGHFVAQALEAGADGYLSKDSEPPELALAVSSVHGGHSYLSPRIAGVFVHRDRGSPESQETGASRLTCLTPRERQVFQLLAIGRTNKEVATELRISLGTAKKHRENLKRKLGCQSSAEIVRLAIREGLLSV